VSRVPARRGQGKPRFARDGLFWFLIHAHPRRRRGVASRDGGAYVACWIHFRQRDGALQLAKYGIREAGWRVRSVQGQRWLDGPAHAERGTRQYYREALECGASFVFHRYPRAS
jgi:hypothetical protein